MAELGSEGSQWAIVIVGNGHGEDETGSLRSLLEARSVDVEFYPAMCHP